MDDQTKGAGVRVCNFNEMFSSPDVAYIVPPFQRGYTWTNAQLESYWEYLSDFISGAREKAFLGAIVLQHTQRTPNEFTIIDGQQRLTTLYLTMLAIIKRATAEKWGDIFDDYKKYLIGDMTENKNEPKIRLSAVDSRQFKTVFDQVDGIAAKIQISDGPKKGRLLTAFESLDKKIGSHIDGEDDQARKKKFLEELIQALRFHMEVVQIHIYEHNPNEIYDKLNTAGRKLRLLDLVRNEVFKSIRDFNQALGLRDSEWDKFEKKLRLGREKVEEERSRKNQKGKRPESRNAIDRAHENVEDGFFYPYALIVLSNTTKNRVSQDLGKHWTKKWQGVAKNERELASRSIKDMSEYALPYVMLSRGHFEEESHIGKPLKDAILRTQKILPDVTYSFLLRVIREVIDGNCDLKKAVKIFEMSETLLVRRYLAGHELTGLTPIFKKLWNSNNGIGNLESLARNMQTPNIKFPKDTEIDAYISSGAVFGRAVVPYVLLQYEEHVTKDSPEQIEDIRQELNIDHMLSVSEAGTIDGAADYVHTLGNLFLMGDKLNKTKWKKSYENFREDGLKHAKFQSTRQVFEKNTKWGVDQIKKRGEDLTDWVVERWPMPKGIENKKIERPEKDA